MTLKRLVIRTKKSLSGLNVFNAEDEPSLPETPKKQSSTSAEYTLPAVRDSYQCRASPAKNSPSRRSRLMGTLRKMRSNLDLTKVKLSDEPASQVDKTPPMNSRPSLMLNFEVSSPDQPMFNTTRHFSNSSAIKIKHSSPIIVPIGTEENAPPIQASLPWNTVPSSPAPIQKAAVQQAILKNGRQARLSLALLDMKSPPIPTPMPGTNLPLDDVNTPEIIVSSPSRTSMLQDGYFALPVTKSKPVVRAASPNLEGPIASDDIRLESAHDQLECLTCKLDPTDPDVILAPDLDKDPFIYDPEGRRSFEGKADCISAYLAHESSHFANEARGGSELRRRKSTWSRHTGLYDGSGYAAYELDVATQQTPSEMRGERESEASTVDESFTNPTTTDGSVIGLDEKEALQDIIRAYAFCLSETDEEREHDAMEARIREMHRGLSEEASAQEACLNSGGTVLSVRELAQAIRDMNRSHGG